MFFKEIVINGPLGPCKSFVIRIEFQVRGSPHVHSFLWIVNAPSLTKNTKNEYIQWVDNIISAYLPNHVEEPKLFELVKTYQLHRHSRTCNKYKNQICRFNFGRFFCNETIVAEPLPELMCHEEKVEIFKWRNELLKKIKLHINTELNPAKKNFHNFAKDDYEPVKSIEEILLLLDIPTDDYYKALRISGDNDFQIHLRRPTDSCFVNNYFKEGLLAWEANIDIQPVLNHYKAITYMCAYLSKTEDECSQAMHHAIKEAHENDLDKCHEMRSIAHAYATKQECSVQEAVYNIMPELWLRKVFPGVLFANNNVPEERYRMCLTEDEIRDLPEESIEMFKRNMIGRYIDRPSQTFANGKFRILDSFFYAEFLRNYYIAPKPVENYCQPEELIDQVIERNHSPSPYPKVIPLMSSKEKLKCRQTEVVLRYHVPNKDMYSEKYAHHLLFMFYPFRNETALKSGEPPTYKNKLCETGVIDILIITNLS